MTLRLNIQLVFEDMKVGKSYEVEGVVGSGPEFDLLTAYMTFLELMYRDELTDMLKPGAVPAFVAVADQVRAQLVASFQDGAPPKPQKTAGNKLQ